MAHRRAKLTPFGRLLIAQRVLELGWTAAEAAKAAGVPRSTAHKWVRRYREEGPTGVEDRSSRARRCPHALPARQVDRILRARRRLKQGPHQLAAVVGSPRSTIYGVLRRHRMSRLAHLDRPFGVPIRYERERPGELVHIDVKKLGRIPPGGGWRKLGRATARGSRRKRGFGYDYLHAAVDDHSRVAYVEVHPDERGETCARFLARAAGLFAEHGVAIEQVMTDNAMNYVKSQSFGQTMAALGITHVRIPPYRPRANGKVERVQPDAGRGVGLPPSLPVQPRAPSCVGSLDRFHDRRRSHTALGGRPPISRL